MRPEASYRFGKSVFNRTQSMTYMATEGVHVEVTKDSGPLGERLIKREMIGWALRESRNEERSSGKETVEMKRLKVKEGVNS